MNENFNTNIHPETNTKRVGYKLPVRHVPLGLASVAAKAWIEQNYYVGSLNPRSKERQTLVLRTIPIPQSTPNIQIHPLHNNIHVSKVHCGSAFEPGASGLPYYCTSICVCSWCTWRASSVDSKKSTAHHLYAFLMQLEVFGFWVVMPTHSVGITT